MSEQKVRIAITGMGACTPIGIGVETFWANALAGTLGTGEIRRFDHSELRTHVGGEIHDFEPERFIAADEVPRMGRGSQLAVAAARMALEQAGLDAASLKRYAPERRAVSFGTTMGEPEILDEIVCAIVADGLENMPFEKTFPLPSCRMSNHVARVCDLAATTSRSPPPARLATTPLATALTYCAAGSPTW